MRKLLTNTLSFDLLENEAFFQIKKKKKIYKSERRNNFHNMGLVR